MCTLWCVSSWCFRLNRLLHCLHRYGFSPPRPLSGRRDRLSRPPWPQNLHRKVSSPEPAATQKESNALRHSFRIPVKGKTNVPNYIQFKYKVKHTHNFILVSTASSQTGLGSNTSYKRVTEIMTWATLFWSKSSRSKVSNGDVSSGSGHISGP